MISNVIFHFSNEKDKKKKKWFKYQNNAENKKYEGNK